MTQSLCLNCSNPIENSLNQKFCCNQCYYDYKSGPFYLNCQKCGTQMEFRSRYFLSRVKYCNRCKLRKFDMIHSYFNELTSDKLITLGQIMVTSVIRNSTTIHIVSDEETLSSIKLKIGSNQPIKKAERGLYRLIITSEELVTDLLRLGVPTSDLWAEMEREDVWEGMKQTHCYRRFSDGVSQFRTKQSKVALWVRDRFSGQIITQSYKDVPRNCMGMEYIVLFRE